MILSSRTRPETPDGEQPAERLGPATRRRFAFGGVLAAVCALAAGAVTTPGWLAVAAIVAGMAGASLLRGFELRAWFGKELSLHQSQSLQAVLDFARWLSPLLDRRRFEAEYVARETGQPSERVAEWSRSRQWWRAVLLPALPALVATIILPHAAVATACWLVTLLAAVVVSPHRREPAGPRRSKSLLSHAAMVSVALLALAVEATALVLAARALPGDPAAAAAGAAAIFAALGLARAVPATPFGLGFFEALALAGLWLAGAASLMPLALLAHGVWVLTACAVGVAYLPRYKLTLADLFDRRLPSLLSRSRRPARGWAAPQQVDDDGIEVTVAIPAYNERERLPSYLPDVLAHLRSKDYAWEVIVADDGSRDGTGDYVDAMRQGEPRLRLLRRPRNGGKGRAVLDAIEAARGRYVLIADADGATPIRELDALRDAVADGTEIAIGSRVAPRAGRTRERHVLRAVIGKVFYGLVNFLAVPGIGDTQCGFKLLRRDVACALFRELGEFGWAFDVEVLYRAQLAGYRVVEVAVEWHEIAGSKLRPVRDASRMLLSLFRIRARNAGFTGATAQSLLAGRSATGFGEAA